MTIAKDIPNWEHKSGYRVNADGRYIIYEHEEKPYEAVIEAMLNEGEDTMEYYTAIFDDSTSNPTELIEAHKIFINKEDAFENLKKRMHEHS